jgi:hypothetical protein
MRIASRPLLPAFDHGFGGRMPAGLGERNPVQCCVDERLATLAKIPNVSDGTRETSPLSLLARTGNSMAQCLS